MLGGSQESFALLVALLMVDLQEAALDKVMMACNVKCFVLGKVIVGLGLSPSPVFECCTCCLEVFGCSSVLEVALKGLVFSGVI